MVGVVVAVEGKVEVPGYDEVPEGVGWEKPRHMNILVGVSKGDWMQYEHLNQKSLELT